MSEYTNNKVTATRKYYGVESTEGKAWGILSNYVIDRSKFFEFGIWVDTTDSFFDKVRNTISDFPVYKKEDRVTQFKNALEDLTKIGLQDNIDYFYSTNRIFNFDYQFDWHIARLQIDEKLKEILKVKKSLMDYIDLEINGLELEFNHPAFYEDHETALMFSSHSEVKVYVLLTENEKVKLEKLGVQFTDELERLLPLVQKGKLTLAEVKAL